MIEIRKGQALACRVQCPISGRLRRSGVPRRRRVHCAPRRDRLAGSTPSIANPPSPRRRGPGYADPDYDLSSEWLATKQRIDAAQQRWADPTSPSRVLLVCGSARNDGSCPGEMSKTFRLLGIAREILDQADLQTDVLDLSLLVSEYGRKIHPCKGCVSTAMPLCNWPCSCYPNHALEPDQ
jgi:hypothetical protein